MRQKTYRDMETSRADMTDFRRPPYAVQRAIRAQAEQIREDPCVNRRHCAWIEDAKKYIAEKCG